ncbi:MAG TPA: cadmium resistance transporter [Methylocella sp.]|nr:cadmium resistance transporter [Methylocella sp.]
MSVAGLTAVSYASSNLDNLIVLSAYCARPGYRSFYIKLTFMLVCLTVLVISLVLGNIADALPANKIHYLGLIPVTLGFYQLLKLAFVREDHQKLKDNQELEEAKPVPSPTFSIYLGFALVLLSNSSDTISLLTPIFADLKSHFLLVCFATAGAMAFLLSETAHILTRHPLSKASFEKLAKWALPFLLIGIGVMVLADRPSDVFIEQA